MSGELKTQCLLLVDDDPLIAEALASALERRGRRTVVCSDPDAAKIYLAHAEVTHVISDVQFTGEFAFEGLGFLSSLKSEMPARPVILITGCANPRLHENALERGAVAVLQKPFDIGSLERLLPDDLPSPSGDDPYEILRVPGIEEILVSDVLSTVFQPIVRLASPITTIGCEALTRVRGRWNAGGIPALFEYAERRSRLAELNIAALAQALKAAAILPRQLSLFINIDPLCFDRAGLSGEISESSRRFGIDLSRVVFEITERSAFPQTANARDAIERLRGDGVRFALDDHGSSYSHLPSMDLIRPSFIKISSAIGTGFELDKTRSSIVRSIAGLASDFDCELILEGVETAQTAAAAVEAGIKLAQGFFFGHPHPAEHMLRRTPPIGTAVASS